MRRIGGPDKMSKKEQKGGMIEKVRKKECNI
jgi:hypothetical protein